MARHGRQPLSEIAEMTLDELQGFAEALAEIIRLEGIQPD